MPPNPTRRKLAIATWSAPREGNIYGKLTVDAKNLVEFVQRMREETGHRITVTHVVGMAVARALEQAPGLNGYLRFGKYHQHDSVDITFLVALEDGADLAKATIRKTEGKTLGDLANELQALAAKLRDGKDEDFEKTKKTLQMLPTWLIRPLVWLTGWMASSMGWSIPALGVRPFPFGSAIVTSVGMFGLDEGFAPPTPFARVPTLVLVGALKDRPIAIDGQVLVRPQLTITATLDHRFIDGSDGGKLAKIVRHLLEHPWEIDGLDAPATAEEPPTDRALEGDDGA